MVKEYLCAVGHYWQHEPQNGADLQLCPLCGGKAVWENELPAETELIPDYIIEVVPRGQLHRCSHCGNYVTNDGRFRVPVGVGRLVL